jgi:hypothetical protein
MRDLSEKAVRIGGEYPSWIDSDSANGPRRCRRDKPQQQLQGFARKIIQTPRFFPGFAVSAVFAFTIPHAFFSRFTSLRS